MYRHCHAWTSPKSMTPPVCRNSMPGQRKGTGANSLLSQTSLAPRARLALLTFLSVPSLPSVSHVPRS